MLRALLLLLPLCLATAADELADLRDKAKVNKRLLVSTHLQLDSATEARFTPVYDLYQRDLAVLDARALELVKKYGDALAGDNFSDDRAAKLIEESLAIDAGEIALRQKYLPILQRALPGRTAMRYLQLEGKLRAIARYEVAATVPLIPGT